MPCGMQQRVSGEGCEGCDDEADFHAWLNPGSVLFPFHEMMEKLANSLHTWSTCFLVLEWAFCPFKAFGSPGVLQ